MIFVMRRIYVIHCAGKLIKVFFWPKSERDLALIFLLWLKIILRLHYRSGPNHAEPNRAGPAVQTMLAWFGPAHFSSV